MSEEQSIEDKTTHHLETLPKHIADKSEHNVDRAESESKRDSKHWAEHFNSDPFARKQQKSGYDNFVFPPERFQFGPQGFAQSVFPKPKEYPVSTPISTAMAEVITTIKDITCLEVRIYSPNSSNLYRDLFYPSQDKNEKWQKCPEERQYSVMPTKWYPQQLPQKGRVFTLYCSKCLQSKRLVPVSSGVILNTPNKIPRSYEVHVKQLFPHDIECDVPIGQQSTCELKSGDSPVLNRYKLIPFTMDHLNMHFEEQATGNLDTQQNFWEIANKMATTILSHSKSTNNPQAADIAKKVVDAVNHCPAPYKKALLRMYKETPYILRPSRPHVWDVGRYNEGMQEFLDKQQIKVPAGIFTDAFDYGADDRMYEQLPSPNYREIPAFHHILVENLIFFTLLCHLNASNEGALFIPDYFHVHDPKSPFEDQEETRGCLPTKLNKHAHLHLNETSLFWGGHNMSSVAENIHQPCHYDWVRKKGVKQFEIAKTCFAGLTPGGSVICPMESDRKLYFGNQNMTITVKRNQLLYYTCDLPHGGTTWNGVQDPTWHLAVFVFLDSTRYFENEKHTNNQVIGPEYYLHNYHLFFMTPQNLRRIGAMRYNMVNLLNKAMQMQKIKSSDKEKKKTDKVDKEMKPKARKLIAGDSPQTVNKNQVGQCSACGWEETVEEFMFYPREEDSSELT